MCSLFGYTIILTLSYTALAQTCYFPNGDESGSDTACNPNSLVSTCCFEGQACLSNGLCVSDPHNATAARFHRGTCTDKNWKSSNCPRECLDIDNNGVPVYSCNQTNTDSYCCFDNCKCSSQFETFSFTTAELYTLTIIGESFTNTHTSTSATSLVTASNSATVSQPSSSSVQTTGSATAGAVKATASSGATEQKSSPNSTAIGVGVGVGVGGAALLAAAAFFFWRRKRANKARYQEPGTLYNPSEAPTNEYCPPAQKHPSSENAASEPHAFEMSADNHHHPVELPAADAMAKQTK
ncbi:uncharacterized protein BDR25DRAFT_375363 [Lindgomyces ingoldianus]|uniref:Uncharacterized protein n=1 Tax=Lindgomyces ingoldianus TaxID=673940 RepID=A0ACB6RBB3_9PLEO|nr:uncharacterized protein BDR25DRAFT_375363 [Lindgomyces ingoldianus]KAF2476426.1 hypothetical protein BDR25DRAFT_375363 [Lindgomyces ingoldianus]